MPASAERLSSGPLGAGADGAIIGVLMTDVPSQAERALRVVGELREELAKTVTESIRSGDFEVAKERLARWRDHAIESLRTQVSPLEARRLDRKRHVNLFMTDPMGNIRTAAKTYDSFLAGLEEQLRHHPEQVRRPQASALSESLPLEASPAEGPSPIFLIHGHDELNLLRLKNLIRDRWQIHTVVMSDQPGKGRTLIEKFEEEAKPASFALALLTPDDILVAADARYAQSRPNVIFELGWFYGRLGRAKVCILFKEGTQLHSDLDGIARIQFSESVLEKVNDIEDELIAASILKHRGESPGA